MTAFINYDYQIDGVNVFTFSASKIRELARLFPFYNFPEGAGQDRERHAPVVVWPLDEDWDPVVDSMEFGWEAIDV
jgi:hypothetical protein